MFSHNSEKNPKLGRNHRYVRFLSNGLKATRGGIVFLLEKYYIVQYSVVLNLKLDYR